MLKKLLIGLAGLIVLLFLCVAAALVITNPEQPPSGSGSAQWLQPGPYRIGTAEMVFTDNTRPTPANRDYAGAPGRRFTTTLWYPEDAQGQLPFVLHSHGLVSSRSDLQYMARHLASHGYVVASADYPLTNGGAPGGPTPADVVNQPADVSFLIDSVLSLVGDRKPFSGIIDLERIGLTGYSLGGLTSTLATFHPRLRDSRVKATVSIAGPAAIFTDLFYQSADTPFLMIAGTADALINHQANGMPIPRRVSNGDLLSIRGGTHLGFAALSEPMMRFMNDPDSLGCAAVLSTLGDRSTNDVFRQLGSASEGVVVDDSIPDICEILPTEEPAHAGRQQMITTIAVLSFFESVFAPQTTDRLAARAQLAASLEQDFPEARFTD
jgi:predicted dienelactone hydrolase